METSTAHDPGGPTYYCGKGFEKPRIPVGQAAILEDERRKDLWRLHMPRNGPHINGYIPMLMLALCANMDAQTVMTAKGAADYVAKYISKYGPGQSVAAKIGSVFLNSGRWQGRQVVPEEWVELSLTRHVPDIGDWSDDPAELVTEVSYLLPA